MIQPLNKNFPAEQLNTPTTSVPPPAQKSTRHTRAPFHHPRAPSRHSRAPFRHSCAGRNPRSRRNSSGAEHSAAARSRSGRPSRHRGAYRGAGDRLDSCLRRNDGGVNTPSTAIQPISTATYQNLPNLTMSNPPDQIENSPEPAANLPDPAQHRHLPKPTKPDHAQPLRPDRKQPQTHRQPPGPCPTRRLTTAYQNLPNLTAPNPPTR